MTVLFRLVSTYGSRHEGLLSVVECFRTDFCSWRVVWGLLHLKMHLGSGGLFGLDHHLSEMVFEFPSLFLQSFDFPVDLFDGFLHHRGVFQGQVV